MKPTIALCTLAALGGVALADNRKADELFKQAKKLMADKRYADACPKFEESYKLDPGIGGELNIARCYEEWGKLGHAYRAYLEAEKQAKEANDSRQPKIHELVVAIEPQVPRLVIHVPKNVDTDGLKVTIDGNVVDDLEKPQLVDPGPKQVEYTLPGGFKKATLIPVERGGTNDVTLELPPAKKAKPEKPEQPEKPEKPDVETPAATGRGQRIAGIAIGGVGLVAIGVSTAMTVSARSKYHDALATHCGGMTTTCDAQGLTDTHAARSTANTATIVFSVGLAAVAGGVVVYLLAPRSPPAREHALYLVPSVSSDGGGIVFGGRL